MIPFYSLADQEIYNKGLSFIPQERFRLADPSFGSIPSASSSDGIMSVVDRNRAALNQAALRQALPRPFIMGGAGQDDGDIDRTNNLGITSLSDLAGFISTPGMVGFQLAGIPGALIGRGLGQVFDNFQNQYTDILGRLNKKTKAAILQDFRDSPEGRKSAKAFSDLQAEIGRTRDAPGGNGGNNSGGGSTSGRDAGMGMGGKQR